MDNQLPKSAQRVQAALSKQGFVCRVKQLPASTRTAPDAAHAVACQLGQIVKSLVFKTRDTQRAVMVTASGTNRVDVNKLAHEIGEPVDMADPEFVRQKTGFAIGGVPPLGHATNLDIYIDRDLLKYDTIWAAAGTPHALFELRSDDLKAMTGGRVVDIRQESNK